MKKTSIFLSLLLISSLGFVGCKKMETPPVSDSQPQQPQVMKTLPQDETVILADQVVVMETNFGTLHIDMLDKAAPKTTENFIRLASRGYYDGVIFHRMVVGDGFKIIQGGDPTGTGRGGESAWGGKFEDEVYKPGTEDFIDPSLYADYNGRYAVYKKGLIAMANAGPDTNGSQFFLMLDDTNLPPAYTIFGKVQDKDFAVLDKILTEVKPDSPTGDGAPDQDLKMVKVTLEK